jgi:hypothetical protein
MADVDVTGPPLDDAELDALRDLLADAARPTWPATAWQDLTRLLTAYEQIRPGRVNPSVERVVLLRVGCRTPGCASSDDTDEGGCLWETTAQARRHFLDASEGHEPYYQWQDNGDGTFTCGRCVTRADCAANGHKWDAWAPCHCAGRIPAHVAAGGFGPQRRTCDHCYDVDNTGPTARCQSADWPPPGVTAAAGVEALTVRKG